MSHQPPPAARGGLLRRQSRSTTPQQQPGMQHQDLSGWRSQRLRHSSRCVGRTPTLRALSRASGEPALAPSQMEDYDFDEEDVTFTAEDIGRTELPSGPAPPLQPPPGAAMVPPGPMPPPGGPMGLPPAPHGMFPGGPGPMMMMPMMPFPPSGPMPPPGAPPGMLQPQPPAGPPPPTQQELEEDFFSLLEEQGVNGFSVWSKVLPKLKGDPRFKRLGGSDALKLFDKFCKGEAQRTLAKKQQDKQQALEDIEALFKAWAAREGQEESTEPAPEPKGKDQVPLDRLPVLTGAPGELHWGRSAMPARVGRPRCFCCCRRLCAS